MPAPAPLAMPEQDFAQASQRVDRKAWSANAARDLAALPARLTAFSVAALITAIVTGGHALWLLPDGLSPAECTVLGLVAMSFFWTGLTLATAVMGATGRRDAAASDEGPACPPPAQRVALLVTLYEEDVGRVETNIVHLVQAIERSRSQPGTGHAYDLFVLSDTQSAERAAGETRMMARLDARFADARTGLYYRQRAANLGHKAGNIADFVRGWGGAYDVMVPLDADSAMGAFAVQRIVDHLATHPEIGIAQSWPRLHRATTVFAAADRFAVDAYGTLTARGYARWAATSASYWGHNAAIRVRAFAAHCGLPPRFLSHDSVEALGMRRAGYGVTLLQDRLASHEEAPPDLVSFLARDRRWCAGNMQHVPLVAAPGVPWMMRFHLAYGVIGYWSAPVWLALILLLGLGDVGRGDVGGGANRADSLALPVLGLVVVGLLATKLMGLARLLMLPGARRSHGGALSLIAKAAGESILSLALAPILLLRRSVTLAELALNASLHRPFQGWAPQRRDACALRWSALVRCHAVETVLGGLLLAAIAVGAVSAWMLPVAVSWAAAIPLSYLTGVRLRRRRAVSRSASSDDRIWGV